MLSLNIQPPKVICNDTGGPTNHKTRIQRGESPVSHTKVFQFEENPFAGQNYAMPLQALSQSMVKLSTQQSLLHAPICKIREKRVNQEVTLFFPNQLDILGIAILSGNIPNACSLFQSAAYNIVYTIFSQSWLLTNLYSDYGSKWNIWWQFQDHELQTGEQETRLNTSPVVLAMLTKQSTLAIELMKVKPVDVDVLIDGLDLSITQLAKKLKLTAVSQYLKQDQEETSVGDVSDDDGGPPITHARSQHAEKSGSVGVGGDARPGDSKKSGDARPGASKRKHKKS